MGSLYHYLDILFQCSQIQFPRKTIKPRLISGRYFDAS